MKIFSSAFKDGEYIPAKYSKKGSNISPPFSFVDIPNETKSLVLVCHDPDASIDGGFTHWIVWGIDPKINEIKENALPPGAKQGLTDWGTNNWGGPQPPSGTHRYVFYLYALDIILDLPENTTRDILEDAIKNHIIDKAVITGLFTSQ